MRALVWVRRPDTSSSCAAETGSLTEAASGISGVRKPDSIIEPKGGQTVLDSAPEEHRVLLSANASGMRQGYGRYDKDARSARRTRAGWPPTLSS